MVDLETLGTTGDAVILSAGLCTFDEHTIDEEMYLEFEVLPQILDGRTVSSDTVKWWKKQDESELYRLVYSSPAAQLTDLTKHVKRLWSGCRTVWSRGTMDALILEDIMDVPWRFYQWRDVRTLDEFGKKMATNSHNALEDAINQAQYVQTILGDK